MRIICTSGYPWDVDPNINNAWTADARYLDSTGSVGLWKPSKGLISLVQATGADKPTYSAAWASGNKGKITGDGVSRCMTGDAHAANATGPVSFTTITALQAITIATIRDAWSFSKSANDTDGCALQIGNDPALTPPWRTALVDDAHHVQANVMSGVAGTGRIVLTTIYDASTFTWTMRLKGVAQTVVRIQPQNPGACSWTRFTILGFRGATSSAFLNGSIRHHLFSRSILTPASYKAHENFMVAEAA